jgi:hypothetical protein
MKKLTFILIAFFVSKFSFSQLKFKPEINFGIVARNATIELSDYSIRRRPYFGFDYNQIKISRNRNLSIDIGQFIYKKKIYVELSSYIRYGHFHYEKDYTTNEIKRFKYDFFADANYYLKWKKEHKSSLILGFGLGFMNLNTSFSYFAFTGERNASGNYLKKELKRGFNFLAPRFLLGVDRNKFKAFVIVHGTPDDDYQPNPTIWLEFKASYKIFQF